MIRWLTCAGDWLRGSWASRRTGRLSALGVLRDTALIPSYTTVTALGQTWVSYLNLTDNFGSVALATGMFNSSGIWRSCILMRKVIYKLLNCFHLLPVYSFSSNPYHIGKAVFRKWLYREKLIVLTIIMCPMYVVINASNFHNSLCIILKMCTSMSS